ncbi:hypothetical protein BAU15_12275 [Enterococcus sp. JM4C]|uniref:EbsA family protein n=1 Tax=Candidatus Enterococcus huntleyi TaxID=1857217 RepID=UPI00137A8A28|nr:EbsA family protein [Enterococcus sp. JM4C]KAF1296052.1 hypothetical protein BAU15_12275 [Enterococcus sp. JM4C]
MKRMYYHWQPELSTTMIYWSGTMMIGFFSLILSLEYTRPYWLSNTVLVIFFFFVYLGWRRSLCLTDTHLEIRYASFWKVKKVLYEEIEWIKEGPKGIELKTKITPEPVLFNMRRKTKEKFIKNLTAKQTTIHIFYDDTLKMSKEE